MRYPGICGRQWGRLLGMTGFVALSTVVGCSDPSDRPGRAGISAAGRPGTLPGGSAGASRVTGGTTFDGGSDPGAAAGAGGAGGEGGEGGGGVGGSTAGAGGEAIPPRWGSSCSAPTGAGVEHSSTVVTDETWLAGDGPHFVRANLVISAKLTIESCAVVQVGAGRTLSVDGNGQLATLVARPGAMLRFGALSALEIDVSGGSNPAAGALVAEGTEADPVVFTSAEGSPVPGDWLGILFGGVVNASTVIDHARIEYAGAPSNVTSKSCPIPGTYGRYNDAAIRIVGGAPAAQFVTNTVIADSGSNGVDRGYLTAYSNGGPAGPDFLATNSFQNIAWCLETYPGPASGACPDPVPCPQ